jgi:hypothetical protein
MRRYTALLHRPQERTRARALIDFPVRILAKDAIDDALMYGRNGMPWARQFRKTVKIINLSVTYGAIIKK